MELGWEVLERLDRDGWFGLGAALGLTLEHWCQALCIQWSESYAHWEVGKEDLEDGCVAENDTSISASSLHPLHYLGPGLSPLHANWPYPQA